MKELNIELSGDYIPINLVEPETKEKTEFRFHYSDDTLNGYRESLEPFLEDYNNLGESGTFDEVDELLGKAFDFLLGEGSYVQIKTIQKSIINRKSLLFQVITLIEKALSEIVLEQDEEKASQYEVEK